MRVVRLEIFRSINSLYTIYTYTYIFLNRTPIRRENYLLLSFESRLTNEEIT